VVTGDFNGDGKLDLAVANTGVSILLGNGNGTFRPHVDYTTGNGPASVAVGDFNSDGKLDLVVANNGGDVSILLGNGNGTFRPHVDYTTGNSPASVAVGDFNGDGKLDLAVANSGASNGISNVSVLLGKGDGTFDAAVNYSAGFGANSVAVGDFNRDGRLDLVVSNFGTGNVIVLLGKGDGTFQTPVDYGTFIPVSVAVGDLNGDGKLDLAVASIPPGNVGPGTVSILLGNGNGTFQSAVDYSVGSNLSAVALGDFNGDGKLDLAVANSGGDVSILLGKGDGTFQPPIDYIANLYSYSIALGDFNRDGRLDLAVADPADSSVSILLQPPLILGPDAVVEPSNLVFATQLASTPSPAQPVLLSNYGTQPLLITSIAASGDFIQTNACGPTLAAGVSCTINVAFKPTQGGTRTGTLAVTDNAPSSPQRVSLSGTGTVVELSPTSLKFACIPERIGHCTCFPLSETTTLTNVGSTSLGISSVAISGPFTQTNTCGASVTANHSCSINVTWSRSPGSGAVTISDNGGGSPQTVSLEGIDACRR
jgi:FG-GAP-like repeat/FG-GAP repeat